MRPSEFETNWKVKWRADCSQVCLVVTVQDWVANIVLKISWNPPGLFRPVIGLLYLFTFTFMSFHLLSHFLPLSLFSCRSYSQYLFISVCDRPLRSVPIFSTWWQNARCSVVCIHGALQRNMSSRLWINAKIFSVFNYLLYVTRTGRAASYLPSSSVRARNGRISTCTLSRVLMACQKLNVNFDCN